MGYCRKEKEFFINSLTYGEVTFKEFMTARNWEETINKKLRNKERIFK
jgi:hypothetical protein